MDSEATERNGDRSDRQRWMAILARASVRELEDTVRAVRSDLAEGAGYDRLRGPETGTVMVEGRAGGGGRRFNLGEATMTRAVVRLADGTLGFAYALGTDRRKAELAAVLDALLQRADETARRIASDVEVLARAQAARREAASRKAAATKVDFFTVTRGHD